MGTGVIWSAVIPAKAGIHVRKPLEMLLPSDWIPAFAGMTGVSSLIPIPNDTSTTRCQSLTSGGSATRVRRKYY